MRLEFTAHYCPPEQARRVMQSKQQQLGAEVSSATVSASSPTAVTALLADGSYDCWSLGCLLYELRCGRPPFTGADADIILATIAEATDIEISAQLQALQQKQKRMQKRLLSQRKEAVDPLQDNEISLLKHLLTVDPSQRYSIEQAADALKEMSSGLSATQKARSVAGVLSKVVQSQEELKSAVQHVGEKVSSVLDLQHGMVKSMDKALEALAKLEVQAKQTLRAVFDVQSSDLPRLFTLLPDALDKEKKPLSAEDANSWKAKFLSVCDDISRNVEKARRKVSA
jgi:serine/threonine protein kinase